MPSCSFTRCTNSSRTKNKAQGITFHSFPTGNQLWNDDWIEIIRKCRGDDNWIPSKTSVICSVHFDANDLYTTKNGLRRVVTYAVPKRLLFEPSKMEEQPAEPMMAVFIPSVHQLSSPDTFISLSSPSSSLTQQTVKTELVESDFEQPLLSESKKASVFLSLDTSLSHPPVKTQPVESDSQQSLSSEASFSLSPGTSLSKLPVKTEPEESDSQPLLSEASVSLSLGSSSSQPPPIRTVLADSQQLLPCESSISFILESSMSQGPSPIGGRSLPSIESNFEEIDPITKFYLEEMLKKKQAMIARNKIKIKTLNQKVRRLKNRNKSLKDILKRLRREQKRIE